MKITRLLPNSLAGLALLAAAHEASAQLVNLNARVSGAVAGPNQSYWANPFNAVSLTLSPGEYDFTLVDPAISSGALYTAWTYNAPWITNYLVFDSTNLSHELFDGAVSTSSSTTALAAFNATVAAGHNVTTYTFATTTTLLFAIPDNIVSDNNGGVSIEVSPTVVAPPEPPPASAVPEPSTYGIIGAIFLTGVAAFRRRIKVLRQE